METNQSFLELKAHITDAINEHKKDQKGDGIWFNFGTGFVLLATTASTLIPLNSGEVLLWSAKILTGLATFLVALERSLNFGARWRYHIDMRNAYQSILDEMNFSKIMYTDKEKLAETLANIRAELRVLRKRGGELPGGKTPPQTNVQ